MKEKKPRKWLNHKDALAFKLARSISEIMIEKGMRVDEFLKKSQLTKRTYYRILKGGNPQFYTLCDIAKGLNVQLKDLLNFDLEKKISSIEKNPIYIFNYSRKKK